LTDRWPKADQFRFRSVTTPHLGFANENTAVLAPPERPPPTAQASLIGRLRDECLNEHLFKSLPAEELSSNPLL
jgi:hypothetical protein